MRVKFGAIFGVVKVIVSLSGACEEIVGRAAELWHDEPIAKYVSSDVSS